MKRAFEKIAGITRRPSPTEDMIVDSTPLEDPKDPDAKWGKYSRGWFKGFKAHFSVNQQGLPLKARIITGNRYDSPFLPGLIENLNPKRVLAEAISIPRRIGKPARKKEQNHTSRGIRETREKNTNSPKL